MIRSVKVVHPVLPPGVRKNGHQGLLALVSDKPAPHLVESFRETSNGIVATNGRASVLIPWPNVCYAQYEDCQEPPVQEARDEAKADFVKKMADARAKKQQGKKC